MYRMHRAAPVATAAGTRQDDEAVRAMDGLRRLVRALHVSLHASQREHGLSVAQLFVLRQIALAPGLSIQELGERTRTAQSSVSEVVARLVRQGHVRRDASPSDRRRAELRLTPRGEATLANAPRTMQERLIDGFDSLADDEQRALVRGLDAWLAAAGLSDVPASMFLEPTEPTEQRGEYTDATR